MADIQRRASVRVNRILRTDLIIINEIGYTLIERKLIYFSLISELYKKTSLIIASNKRFDEWAEMMIVAMIGRLFYH